MTDRREHPNQLDELLAIAADSELDPQQQQELIELLRDDPGAQEEFVGRMAVHAWLQWQVHPASPRYDALSNSQEDDAEESIAGQAISAPPVDHVDPSSTADTLAQWARPLAKQMKKPPAISIATATLAVTLLIAAMAFMVPPFLRDQSPPANQPFIAQLTYTHQAVWAQGQVGPTLGAHLPIGQRLELKSGQLDITYDTGARVLLEGPAVYEVLEANRGYLHRGSLVGQVAFESAKGFTVETPFVRVEDQGTEFGVEVAQSGAAEITVLKGAVDLIREPSGDQPEQRIRLTKNQSASIKTRRGTIARHDEIDEQIVKAMRVRLKTAQRRLRSSTIVLDNGFENPVQPPNDWKQAAGAGTGELTGSAWTITSGAGITRNFSDFHAHTPALQGMQFGLLQNTGSFVQTVSGFEVGAEYSLVLLTMKRRAIDGGNDLEVLLDAGLASEINLIDINEVTYSRFTPIESHSFVAAKPSYELTIRSTLNGGTLSGDRTTFIDYIRFNQWTDAPPLSDLQKEHIRAE